MAEALELSTFMSGISDLDGELQRLDRGDWAGESRRTTPLPGLLLKHSRYFRCMDPSDGAAAAGDQVEEGGLQQDSRRV